MQKKRFLRCSIIFGIFILTISFSFQVKADIYIKKEPGKNIFIDITESNSSYHAIDELYQRKIISGYPDNTFQPERIVNRVEALKIIALASKIDLTPPKSSFEFKDTVKTAWYWPIVNKASFLKIIQGYPDGTLQPDKTINLVEALAMLLRAEKVNLKNIIITADPFNDVPKNSWFAPYIQFAKDKNLIGANHSNRVYPNQNITRKKLVEIIYRYLMWKENKPQTGPKGLNEPAPAINSTVDNDGDGMTDAGEIRYGFDPKDPASFPKEPSFITEPNQQKIGDQNNKISFSFSTNFPEKLKNQYREFLKRLTPIAYEYLGPPAESFNIEIVNKGEKQFMTVNSGRTIKVNDKFNPRTLAHEIIHAWKGKYLITSDENWYYDTTLSGFEEGLAEGGAYEMMHEYTNIYPNDETTKNLLSYKPGSYWSPQTTFYDFIKEDIDTTAGEFWTFAGTEEDRYSIAATTLQAMIQENPYFLREFHKMYYEKIAGDKNFRPTRENIIAMWETLVPTINNIPLSTFFNKLPIFAGKKLVPGIYILESIKPFANSGEQVFAVGYVNERGVFVWGLTEEEKNKLPSYIKTIKGSDGFYYIDLQNTDLKAEISDANNNVYLVHDFKTAWDRRSDNTPDGLGWIKVNELAMQNFPLGLYKEKITATEYISHEQEAQESFYFIGLKGFLQNQNESVIMIGIDGVPSGKANISINGKSYQSDIKNGVAIFKGPWNFNTEGKFEIKITNSAGKTQTYYRTLITAGTYDEFWQQQFVIQDVNFNGKEDNYESF